MTAGELPGDLAEEPAPQGTDRRNGGAGQHPSVAGRRLGLVEHLAQDQHRR